MGYFSVCWATNDGVLSHFCSKAHSKCSFRCCISAKGAISISNFLIVSNFRFNSTYNLKWRGCYYVSTFFNSRISLEGYFWSLLNNSCGYLYKNLFSWLIVVQFIIIKNILGIFWDFDLLYCSSSFFFLLLMFIIESWIL